MQSCYKEDNRRRRPSKCLHIRQIVQISLPNRKVHSSVSIMLPCNSMSNVSNVYLAVGHPAVSR